MPENEKNREQRQYAWNYFHLHAGQRMSLFNFFVLISALLTAALGGTFGEDCKSHILGLFLGLTLPVISFVFWRIDQRVAYLVKRAEGTLKSLETSWANKENAVDENTALFSAENRNTAKLRAELCRKYPFQAWVCPVTYSECFRVIYVVFGALGVLGVILSIAALVY